MRNVSKILCVVLALVVALSAASCSLTKQYSYKTDDVELPIGVYICYLNDAYNEARSLAQKDEKYDSEAGTYDGSESFLKMEITDTDGKTAVAEDWIKEKAEAALSDAVAVYYEFNKLGCELDEKALSETRKEEKNNWDNEHAVTYSGYSYTVAPNKDAYEPWGVSFESYFLAEVKIGKMKEAVRKAEYAVDGPRAVSDEDLVKLYEDNYTSYHLFYENLFSTETDSASGTSTSAPFSEDKIKKYTADFDAYAAAINGGATFSEQFESYKQAYNASAAAEENVVYLDPDYDTGSKTYNALRDAIIALKEGEAKQIIIGDDEKSQSIYLIYKEPIADTTEEYLGEDKDSKRDEIISVAKQDDFNELLKTIAASISIDKSSAINDYKPSMFE